MTKEEMEKLDHISDSELQKDRADTVSELQQLQKEVDALSGNRMKNKVQIYMREGGISQRQKFVSKLDAIIAFRKERKEKIETVGFFYAQNLKQ